MELYEGLLTRRSIRRFTGAAISRDDIFKFIKAGMYAPSANDTRPWHFIIVDDKEKMKRIMEVHPYSSMLSKASHAIVVCGDEKLEHGPGYYLLDCSAATQNILLAAHASGFGAVWLGVEPRKERKTAIREIFGLPEYISPVSIIALGIPVKIPEKIPQRFDEKRIRNNNW